MPSSTLFEKMPPIANTDWPTPSIRNSAARDDAADGVDEQAAAEVREQQPRIDVRQPRAKSLISRNSSVGIATVNTKRVSASDAGVGHAEARQRVAEQRPAGTAAP